MSSCRNAGRFTGLPLLCLILSGCLGLDRDFSPDAALEGRILTEHSVPRPEVGLLELTPDMRRYLDRHIDGTDDDHVIVERLQSLLFDDEHLAIEYDESATLTAEEAFRQRQANCLSLVSLYIAMARHYDLEVDFQTVDIRPRWDRQGELFVVSEHVNALGDLGRGTRYIVDFTPDVRLRPHTARLIDDTEALARYFNNRGVESLVEGEALQAVRQFQHALRTDPSLGIAWNNIGSAYNQLGRDEYAEYAYRRSYSLDRGNTTAINNLAGYYSRIGEDERAESFRNALERAHRANPYYHFMRGNLAYERQDYEAARGHYQQALRREDREPDFYHALGLAQRELGREEQARELITVARALREYGDQRYQPSNQRLRILEEEDSILRAASPGFSIRAAR